MSDHPDDHASPGSGSGRSMGFWEHLNELRGTLLKSAAAFAICAGLVGYYLHAFKSFVMWPFDRALRHYPGLEITFGTNGMTEGVNIIVEACVFGGLTLAAPFILFFIAQFIAPALTQRETKVVLPMCVAACTLFLAGGAFAFFVLLPAAIQVFIEVNLSLEAAFRWSLADYYSVFLRTVFGIGAAFEFPLLIVMLVWIGIINTAFLRKYRRHAVVLIFIVSAVITLSTEPLSQLLCAAPLYLLYEIAIWVSAGVEKHRERSGAAVLIALLALARRERSAGNLIASRA